MRIDNDVKLDFTDVLIRPKRSTVGSRKDVVLERSYNFRHGSCYYGVPIIAANMDGVGTIAVANELEKHNMSTCFSKSIPLNDLQDYLNTTDKSLSFPSVGIGKESFEQIKRYVKAGFGIVCIDVANGYTEYFVDFVKKVRATFNEITIIAGNVATSEMVEELLLAGADIVKVGIGPGSACLTRVKTGVGYPQLSSIIECADAAHGLNGHVIADGGCASPGDVAKAFAAGADFVMLGSMFAGSKQGAERIIEGKDGKKYVEFYGMSSKTANKKHFGGLKDYRASEGRTVHVPFKGDINEICQDILGGLRSACTYVGAMELRHLSKCTTFVRVNNTHSRVMESYTIGQ